MAEIRLTAEEVGVLKDRSKIMYSFGQIAYDDVFKEHHVTTYCFKLHVDDSYTAWTDCDTFNDAN